MVIKQCFGQVFSRLTENVKPTGIGGEFSSAMPIDACRRFEGLNVIWNILLEAT